MASFIKLAAREAQKSDMKIKHGSTLVVNGKIVSRGHNHSRSSINGVGTRARLPKALFRTDLPMCSVHAEMHCLLKSCFKQRPLPP